MDQNEISGMNILDLSKIEYEKTKKKEISLLQKINKFQIESFLKLSCWPVLVFKGT